MSTFQKSIELKKLWPGAVFAFKQKGDNGFPPVVYHCDYIDKNEIHYTSMHNDQEYKVKVYDRFVWLRT